MRTAAVLAILFLTASVAAEEITVDKVIAAKSFGAPDESILAKIKDPANTVAPVAAADPARLRAASVSEAVITALLSRAPLPTTPPAAPAVQPDNANLVTIVKLVQAGTSEAMVADLVKQQGVAQRPTANDLIYLKENKISEGVIRALMEAPLNTSVPGATSSTARGGQMPEQMEIEGLVLKKGFLAKNRPGRMVLRADKIEWLDGTNQADSFDMFPAGLKAVGADCSARPDGKFCYEVEMKMLKGSDFSFVDAKMDVGGNDSISAFLKAVRLLYPKLPVVENVK